MNVLTCLIPRIIDSSCYLLVCSHYVLQLQYLDKSNEIKKQRQQPSRVNRQGGTNSWTCTVRGCSHITSAKFGGFQTPPPPLVSNGQHLPDPPPPLVILRQHLPDPLSHYEPLNSSKNTCWHDISMDWDVFWTYVLSWLYIVRPSLHKLFLFHIYLVV